MAEILSDSIDWSAYARQTEASLKVRRASAFADDLEAEFAHREAPKSVMFSTKLRDVIEFRPGEMTCWAGYSGHRKALALDTPIPTPEGWKTMGELRAGDSVFDENGAPCHVVVKSPTYTDEECYRLRFSDGTEVVAHAGHEWLTDTVRSRQSARTAKRYDLIGRVGAPTQHAKREFARIRTTREIHDTLRVTEGGFRGHCNHSIRIARPLVLPSVELPVHPYVLGAWLGDGHSLDGCITVADQEVTAAFVANGYPVVKRPVGPLLYGVPGLKVQLRALGVLGDKHIPQQYLRGSQDQREELLRGLMDTDGSAARDGTLSFCSTRECLALGVAELVCSLGWQCSVRRGIAKLNGREIGPKWEVTFSADRPVFAIARKQARSKDALSTRAQARFIVACDLVPSVAVQCIEVDSTSHLYLASKAMIPTHNSMFVGQVALDLCVQRERSLIASMEMSPGRTLARMVRQAVGISSPGPDARKRFAKWTDDRLWLFDHMGRVTPETMQSVCMYFADELNGRHVFIDSMMMVCGSEESLDEQKQFATDLCRLAQETGMHVHLVTHCRKPQSGAEDKPPTKYDLRGSAAISDQASNIITVWSNKPKIAKLQADPNDLEALAQPDAAVTVEKQRNGAWEGRLKIWWHEASLRFIDDRTSAIEPYRMERDAA